MFVKIQYWEVKKEYDEDGHVIKWRNPIPIEHCYDVNHYALFSAKDEPKRQDVSEQETQKEMTLVLDLNKCGPEGSERTINFFTEQDKQVIEIFVMNNHGKTIQRYIY